jgi:hypothetical protein
MSRIKKFVMARLSLSSGRASRGPGGDSGDRATQPSSPTAHRFHLGGRLARAITQKVSKLDPKLL